MKPAKHGLHVRSFGVPIPAPAIVGRRQRGALAIALMFAVGSGCSEAPTAPDAATDRPGGPDVIEVRDVLIVRSDTAVLGTAHATLGPGGGQLTGGGVIIEFPPGAFPTTQELTLTVREGPVIQIQPDLELLEPAHVAIASALLPPLRNAIAMHLDADGEWYKIDDVVIDASSAAYDTTNFSDNAIVGPHEADDWRSLWVVGDVFPTLVETEASGDPYRYNRPRRGDQCLVKAMGYSYDTATKRRPPRDEDEATVMSREAERALGAASALVRARIGPDYGIHLNGAYDSTGLVHGYFSLHNYGAALDVALCKNINGRCQKVTNLPLPLLTGAAERAKMGLLPPILVESGFTWVWYEDERHIHASITSPSCRLSRCPSDPLWLVCGGDGRSHCYPAGSTCCDGANWECVTCPVVSSSSGCPGATNCLLSGVTQNVGCSPGVTGCTPTTFRTTPVCPPDTVCAATPSVSDMNPRRACIPAGMTRCGATNDVFFGLCQPNETCVVQGAAAERRALCVPPGGVVCNGASPTGAGSDWSATNRTRDDVCDGRSSRCACWPLSTTSCDDASDHFCRTL